MHIFMYKWVLLHSIAYKHHSNRTHWHAPDNFQRLVIRFGYDTLFGGTYLFVMCSMRSPPHMLIFIFSIYTTQQFLIIAHCNSAKPKRLWTFDWIVCIFYCTNNLEKKSKCRFKTEIITFSLKMNFTQDFFIGKSIVEQECNIKNWQIELKFWYWLVDEWRIKQYRELCLTLWLDKENSQCKTRAPNITNNSNWKSFFIFRLLSHWFLCSPFESWS